MAIEVLNKNAYVVHLRQKANLAKPSCKDTTKKCYLQKGKYLQRVLPRVLSSHSSVFTHNDLQRKNIMIRNDGTPFVIDWESSAFYPRYYEYYSAMIVFGYDEDDWHVWVGKMLHEYVVELGWLDIIRRDLLL